jgi:hypothetical protein
MKLPDIQPVVQAHNEFMEKHGIERESDLLIGLVVMFVSRICGNDKQLALAFLADMASAICQACEDGREPDELAQ